MVVKHRFRLYLFTLVILLGFGALAQRLWNLSVERHDEFIHKVPGTTVVRARIPGTRGEIRDRNGEIAGLQQVLLRGAREPAHPGGRIQEAARGGEQAAAQGRAAGDSHLHGQVTAMDRSCARRKETDIVMIFNEVVIEALNKLGLAVPYNANQLARALSHALAASFPGCTAAISPSSSSPSSPSIGLACRASVWRSAPSGSYLYDSFACHVLGYVNQADVDKALGRGTQRMGQRLRPGRLRSLRGGEDV